MYSLGINLVDLGILLILLFFIRDGYRKGFFALSLEMSSFVLGIFVALMLYHPVGVFATNTIGISRSFAKVLAFLLLWLAVESVVPALTAHLYLKVPASWLQSKWNYRAGVLPAMVESLLLCTFLLSLAISFPFPPLLKQHIFASYMGEPMVRSLQSVDAFAGSIFGESGRETLSFMTIGRQENVSFNLGFTTEDIFPDPAVEQRMFEYLNAERVGAGLPPLVMDQSLVEVARLHGSDMFRRGYFSHITPEGLTPSDRAVEAGVDYDKYGENLAYAPDVITAHTGLMRSERHRRNILSAEFKKVGIGVQNAGSNGLIFVQNFSD